MEKPSQQRTGFGTSSTWLGKAAGRGPESGGEKLPDRLFRLLIGHAVIHDRAIAAFRERVRSFTRWSKIVESIVLEKNFIPVDTNP